MPDNPNVVRGPWVKPDGFDAAIRKAGKALQAKKYGLKPHYIRYSQFKEPEEDDYGFVKIHPLNDMKGQSMYMYCNRASESVKALAKELGAKRIKVKASKYRGKAKDTVVNWGCSDIDNNEVLKAGNLLNHPDAIKQMVNKRSFFETLSEHDDLKDLLPEFTTTKLQASQWCEEGSVVIARNVLTGHSGEGIDVLETAEDVQKSKAKLFTKYFKKKHEFRLHCYKKDGEIHVVDIQQKKRAHHVDNVNWKIRSHQNGFIYARQEVNTPEAVTDCVVKVARKTGLDFGAYDIVYNERYNTAKCLEVNTAPGLEGHSILIYADIIRRLSE